MRRMSEERGSTDHPELVVFREARNPFEARIIAAVLEDAGIPVFVAGGMLADEFALSQRMMNLQSVAVQVPKDRLADAEQALAAARAGGEALVQDEVDVGAPAPEPAEPVAAAPRSRSRGWTILCALLALGFAVLWVDARNALADARTSPFLDYEPTSDGWRFRSKSSRAIAQSSRDADRDGIPEATTWHDRAGRPTQTAHDVDENNEVERTETFGPDGRRTTESRDADGDGRFELVRNFHPDGTESTWQDVDGDWIPDRCEVRGADGTKLVQEWRAAEGMVTVR
jgi:hypothetical protein